MHAGCQKCPEEEAEEEADAEEEAGDEEEAEGGAQGSASSAGGKQGKGKATFKSYDTKLLPQLPRGVQLMLPQYLTREMGLTNQACCLVAAASVGASVRPR